LDGEYAPQIAGIIDERGPFDFTDKKKWKIIKANDEGDLVFISHDERSKENDENIDKQNIRKANIQIRIGSLQMMIQVKVHSESPSTLRISA